MLQIYSKMPQHAYILRFQPLYNRCRAYIEDIRDKKRRSPAITVGLYFLYKLEIPAEFRAIYFNFCVKLEIKYLFLMPRFQIHLTN